MKPLSKRLLHPLLTLEPHLDFRLEVIHPLIDVDHFIGQLDAHHRGEHHPLLEDQLSSLLSLSPLEPPLEQRREVRRNVERPKSPMSIDRPGLDQVLLE